MNYPGVVEGLKELLSSGSMTAKEVCMLVAIANIAFSN